MDLPLYTYTMSSLISFSFCFTFLMIVSRPIPKALLASRSKALHVDCIIYSISSPAK